MLLTMDDVTEKLDVSNMKKLTPFEWLLALTPIALEKLHLQEKHERLEKESRLKRPIVPVTRTLEHDDDPDYCQETRTPSKKRKHHVLDGTIEKKKKKKNMRNRRRIELDYFVGDPRLEQATIPERFRRHIETRLNGRDIRLVVQKRLYKSDLEHNEGRLSIPAKKMSCEGGGGGGLLTRDEEEWLRDRGPAGRDPVPGMVLKLVDPELGEGKIVFKLWEMKKKKSGGRTSYMYVLARYWNGVVEAHGLKPGEVVQVWGFRMGEGEPGRLGLALVRLGKENGGEGLSCSYG